NVAVFVCFFFQAEDGIRDWSVTGVQTCALPISAPAADQRVLADGCAREVGAERGRARSGTGARDAVAVHQHDVVAEDEAEVGRRSEERRVGKEGRSRGEAEQYKKKKGKTGTDGG